MNAFKIHMLAEAISDARVGYVKKLDARMTNFHQSVYAIASEEYPQLKMAWLEQAGFDSSIIHLPHALPARGDSLVMKVKMDRQSSESRRGIPSQPNGLSTPLFLKVGEQHAQRAMLVSR